MNAETREQLNRVYLNLKTLLTLKKRLKDNSVLVAIINIKSNDAYKLLSESGIKPVSIPREVFDSLVAGGLIRMAEKPDKYVITVKGIWEIESRNGAINTDILLEHIDRKFFDLFREGGQLTEKEKVILLAMIAVRSFTKESALDLKKGENVLTCLQSLIQSSFELLSRHRIIRKLKLGELFGAQGNEHPVSHLIRHTDALLKRTRGIYKTLGKQKYYLELYDGGVITEEALMTLLGYIFGSAMTTELKQEFSKFCLTNAYEQSTYLFDLSVHRFANPIYDEQINEALEKYYASKYKWDSDEL